MTSRRFRIVHSAGVALLAVIAAAGLYARSPAQSAPAVSANTAGEWHTYGGDLGSTRYSPLDQITRTNFNSLQVAWQFRTDSFGPRPELNFESTPLMAGGMIYCTVGSRRDVVALDAATGELLWTHREQEGARGDAAPRKLSGRGLAYWSDGSDSR
ncbi:MAG: PQQ-binding-like beta-propeller repeat protein, partial [Alphaproteobacteria bacterium]|nr:PQQ-binding-like beta-propeller repeat protein [Alphaproteobacteria bacterium]